VGKLKSLELMEEVWAIKIDIEIISWYIYYNREKDYYKELAYIEKGPIIEPWGVPGHEDRKEPVKYLKKKKAIKLEGNQQLHKDYM
jgi:hypothetical protein